MSEREEMMALANQVGALSGSYRVIDAAIAKMTGAAHGSREIVYYESRSVEYIDEQAPHYTASLDDAMTLVPEGWSVGLGDLRGYTPIIWRAHLRDHNDPSYSTRQWVEGHASTPALALTAAAIRALASKPTTAEEPQ